MKVRIQCTTEIHFDQEVNMNPEDFEKLKDLAGDDVSQCIKADREIYSLLEDYIDISDYTQTSDEFNDVYVELAKEKTSTNKTSSNNE